MRLLNGRILEVREREGTERCKHQGQCVKGRAFRDGIMKMLVDLESRERAGCQ